MGNGEVPNPNREDLPHQGRINLRVYAIVFNTTGVPEMVALTVKKWVYGDKKTLDEAWVDQYPLPVSVRLAVVNSPSYYSPDYFTFDCDESRATITVTPRNIPAGVDFRRKYWYAYRTHVWVEDEHSTTAKETNNG